MPANVAASTKSFPAVKVRVVPEIVFVFGSIIALELFTMNVVAVKLPVAFNVLVPVIFKILIVWEELIVLADEPFQMTLDPVPPPLVFVRVPVHEKLPANVIVSLLPPVNARVPAIVTDAVIPPLTETVIVRFMPL